MTTPQPAAGDLEREDGVWVAYYADRSGFSVYATEIDALRAAVGMGLAVKFLAWGDAARAERGASCCVATGCDAVASLQSTLSRAEAAVVEAQAEVDRLNERIVGITAWLQVANADADHWKGKAHAAATDYLAAIKDRDAAVVEARKAVQVDALLDAALDLEDGLLFHCQREAAEYLRDRAYTLRARADAQGSTPPAWPSRPDHQFQRDALRPTHATTPAVCVEYLGSETWCHQPEAHPCHQGSTPPPEPCRIGHSLYGLCELDWGHDGPHSRVPGGATEPVTWEHGDCPCELCVRFRGGQINRTHEYDPVPGPAPHALCPPRDERIDFSRPVRGGIMPATDGPCQCGGWPLHRNDAHHRWATDQVHEYVPGDAGCAHVIVRARGGRGAPPAGDGEDTLLICNRPAEHSVHQVRAPGPTQAGPR